MSKPNKNPACDCVIGEMGEMEDDREFHHHEFRRSECTSEMLADIISKKWKWGWAGNFANDGRVFSPYNYCRDCGADLRAISGKFAADLKQAWESTPADVN